MYVYSTTSEQQWSSKQKTGRNISKNSSVQKKRDAKSCTTLHD